VDTYAFDFKTFVEYLLLLRGWCASLRPQTICAKSYKAYNVSTCYYRIKHNRMACRWRPVPMPSIYHIAAPASIPQQAEETRQRPLILVQVIPSSNRSLEWGRSVCTQHKILGSPRSPRLAPRVCTARVPSSNQSAVLSQCTIAVHAVDAPRPISTGKPLPQ
jgi:hypothetical protein